MFLSSVLPAVTTGDDDDDFQMPARGHAYDVRAHRQAVKLACNIFNGLPEQQKLPYRVLADREDH